LPVKFEVSVMQVGKSLRITIPKEIGKHLNIVKGDLVELWVDNHNIVVEKKR
jgi:AbrB family looped-hinge helix DNA binding protein